MDIFGEGIIYIDEKIFGEFCFKKINGCNGDNCKNKEKL